MEKSKFKDILFRYLFATVGLFFVAFGIALSIVSNFGTAPLSCPAYVLNLRFTSISVGTFTFIFNLIYIVIQLVLFRDKFEKRYWLQVVASAILGYFIDASLWMCSWIVWDGVVLRVTALLVACLFTALGISIELAAKAWMLSAELTNVAIIYAFPKLSFGTAKIIMDFSLVVLSAVASYFFFGNLLGNAEPNIAGSIGALLHGTTDSGLLDAGDSKGIVISWGTLVLAFIPGYLIKYTNRLIS